MGFKSFRNLIAAVGIAIITVVTMPGQSLKAATFYKDKVITIVIAFGPGGVITFILPLWQNV